MNLQLVVSFPCPNSVPPGLNHIYLKRGRELASDRRHEVLISATFAEANDLVPGDSLGAVINGAGNGFQLLA
jgi:hypothetical protein